jgi:glycosyltransferase involved in cell wall biosynthesis
MKNISVIVVVYNEEKRIETFIKSFLWSNDLIIVDKSSTDATRDIISKYPMVKMITTDYSDTGDEIKYGIESAQNTWVMTLTASDIIHPNLVRKLTKLINDDDFTYDVIALPFAIYVFGIRDIKRSPWCAAHKEWMYKKHIVQTSTVVHKEMFHKSKNIYVMPYSDDENLFHLTHETMESFMERHIRYTRIETNNYEDEKRALQASFKDFLNSVKEVCFKRKSFLKGWDGVALGLAYISYFILKFLFVWQKFRGHGVAEYQKIRSEILTLWDKKSEEIRK